MISGTPVERVCSFKYLGVNISKDLTWTTHIQTQVQKARQRLYHLRQVKKFRVSPAILKTFYSGAIESVLTLDFIFSYYLTTDTKRLPSPAWALPLPDRDSATNTMLKRRYFLPIFMYILLCYVSVTYFALSIERTWPDLHFTTNYILYNYVCDE